MSIWPNRASKLCRTSSRLAGSSTSAAAATASPPNSRIAAATSSARAARRPRIATLAPACANPRVLNEHLLQRVAALDHLIALGTHPPKPEPAVARLLGIAAGERGRRSSGARVFSHRWDPAEDGWRPGRVVVLEFPTMEQARAWYHCAEYEEHKRLPFESAETDVVFVEGVPA
jgi:uncharacterized protein DUF1330